jgi:arabinosyltransferase C
MPQRALLNGDRFTRRARAARVSTRVRVALIAATIGLVPAVVAFVGPADVTRAHITWRPGSEAYRPLPLFASYPEQFTLSTPCATVRNLPNETTLTRTALQPPRLFRHSLAVVSDTNSVRVDIGSRPGFVRMAVPASDPCTIRARFLAGPGAGQVSLEVGGRTVSRSLERVLGINETERTWPVVVGLYADPALRNDAGTVVSIVTTPTGSSTSTRQAVAGVLAVVALVVAAASLLARSRNRRSDDSEDVAMTVHSPRLTPSDLVVSAFALVALVLTPPFFDDGWVGATREMYSRIGSFDNTYTKSGYAQPLGFWWNWLNDTVWHSTHSLAVLRITPLILLVLSFWLLRRRVLDSVIAPEHQPFAHGIAALAFGLGGATLSMTLRPEAIVAFLAVLALVSLVSFVQRPGSAPLFALGVICALAVTVHPGGLVVVLMAAAVLPTVWRWCFAEARVERLLSTTAVAIVAFTFAVLLLSLDTDLTLFRRSYASFNAAGSYNASLIDRFIARLDWLQFVSGLQRYAVVLIILVGVLYLAVRRGIYRDDARLAGDAALLGYVGLLVAGSIWAWHFGALVPGAALLAVLAGTQLLETKRRTFVPLVGTTLALSLAASWALKSRASFVPGDLVVHTWDDFPHLDAWWWAALAAFAAVVAALTLGRQADSARRVERATLAGATCLILVPILMTWGFLIVDAGDTPGWSVTRQAFDELTGRGGCGIGDDIRVVTKSSPLGETRVDQWSRPLASPQGFDPLSRALTAIPEDAPVWGTYHTSTGATGSRTQPVATPWFDVHGISEVAFWTVGKLTSPASLQPELVIDEGGERKLVRPQREPSMDSESWALHELRLPSSAVALRLVMRGGPSDRDWLGTTAPVRPRYQSLTDATEHEPVWRAPYEYFAVPCRAMPPVRGGVYTDLHWIVGPSLHNFSFLAVTGEYQLIERGCVDTRRAAPDRRCLIELPRTAATE